VVNVFLIPEIQDLMFSALVGPCVVYPIFQKAFRGVL